MPTTLTEPADLALFRRVEGDTVIRSGKLFHTGDYPDKQFSMTDAELQASTEGFTSAPVGVEHLPTIFDGKVGEVRALRAAGSELFGEVALPKWLDDVCGPDPLKVSCEWDRESKKLVRLGLVRTPRVSDAAVMSAYAAFTARHDTNAGQGVLQMLHDLTATHGARCKSSAQMHSAHEASALQQAHDLTVQHGARCQTDAASYSEDAGQSDPGKEKPLKPEEFIERMKALFTGEAATTSAGGTAELTAPAAMSGETEETKKLRADLEHERAARLKERKEHIAQLAATFAEGEITANRALPREKDAIIADFTQSAEDDLRQPVTVTFSESETQKTGSRVDALRARYGMRHPHTLTQEIAKDAVVLFNRQRTAEPEDEETEAVVQYIRANAEKTAAKNGRGK